MSDTTAMEFLETGVSDNPEHTQEARQDLLNQIGDVLTIYDAIDAVESQKSFISKACEKIGWLL